jgi:GGDEF domain-containing protein
MTAAKTPETTTATRAPSRLSIAQMLHVMRVEFHRARTQRYPLVCLMIAVEGLESLLAQHGHEGKARAVRASYDLLRKITSAHGYFGMALMSGDRVMAVFPNMPPTRAGEMGHLLCAASKTTELELGGEKHLLALSLGAAHNLLAETNSSFEGIVERAGRALSIATENGGARYVMWREAEAELDELRGELQQATRAFQEQHAVLVEETSTIGGLQQSEVIDRIQAIFGSAERTPDVVRLEKEILALAAKELHEERQKAVQAQVEEHRRQMDVLERRIAKLTSVLGMTEEELKRVMAMKNIDAGVASLFRTVQGLSASDDQAETKKAMMGEIFKANLAFQKREAVPAA